MSFLYEICRGGCGADEIIQTAVEEYALSITLPRLVAEQRLPEKTKLFKNRGLWAGVIFEKCQQLWLNNGGTSEDFLSAVYMALGVETPTEEALQLASEKWIIKNLRNKKQE